ncbi:type VI secretion system Vgr family protein [Burkholderia ubonensis]|uniref:type VI secretion system Vgr family protein n=1 Tax=Burkholderia ubonensis TaxID=101571 RepID=UPI0005D971E1|nr:type VI secretion system Vgr family protein [Burkholderia ubonensis]AJX14380.1 Rhs element Vgr family protein [Burkholderia ubonensis MSMB22]
MDTRDLMQAIRGGLIQQDRLLKLDSPLGNNVLIPHQVVGHSRIGRDFEFVVDVVSSTNDIELKKLIAQPVTLWIQQSDRTYVPHHGYVHTARRLGADGGLTFHQITFASWMHFLKFRRDQRIWQDKSVDSIVTDVFNAHPQARGSFEFDLAGTLPSLSFCRQNETDWNFVHRLLESEGLFGFWKNDEDGQSHRLVITDRLTALDQAIPLAFYRAGTSNEADALTQWSGVRMLQSTSLTTRTFDYKNPASSFNTKGTSLPTMPNQGDLPDQAEVYEYTGAYTFSTQQRGDALSKVRLEEWESRSKRFFGLGGWRGSDAGKRFTLMHHPEHDCDPFEQREFATIEVRWTVQNNLPIPQLSRRFPQGLQGRVDAARASGMADGEFDVHSSDGSVGFFWVELEAQRTIVPFRSPLDHTKPATHIETAIVVGPKEEEVYTDELNRIKVQFIWDRINGANERASCWVRVAQSDTGNGYGAIHPPRVGEEVLIDYVGGDCDRPIAIARVYNGATKPQWHTNGILSGYRSKEFSGTGFNQMVMDDATGQNRVQLMSSSANSLLHLGYLIDQDGNQRGSYLGSGFDLRSDAFGAVRAGQGLYVTTHPKRLNSQLLDVQETQEQLVTAESLIESLADASTSHHAETLMPGHKALKQFTDNTQNSVSPSASGGRTAGGGQGSANAFKSPVMLFGSRSGVAISTQDSAHISATQHINFVSGQSTYVAVGKSLIASAVDKLSLFVQKAGMKLIAAAGKVRIESQSDDMALASLKDLTITSTDGKITLNASKEIWIGVGGSYIRITGQGIENGTAGQIWEKCAKWSKPGAASMRMPLPDLPGEKQYSAQFTVRDGNGEILRNYSYRLESENGPTWYGRTDENGLTQRVWLASPQNVHLYPHDASQHGDEYDDDPRDC